MNSGSSTNSSFLQQLGFVEGQQMNQMNQMNLNLFFPEHTSTSYLTGVPSFPVQDMSGYSPVAYPQHQQVVPVHTGSLPASPSQHQQQTLDRVLNSSPSQSFFDTQGLSPPQHQVAATGYQPFFQLGSTSTSPLVQPSTYSQLAAAQQPSLYNNSLAQANVYASQPTFQGSAQVVLQQPVEDWIQKILNSNDSNDFLSKVMLIQQLSVDNQKLYIHLEQLKMEQQQLKNRKLPEVVEIIDDDEQQEEEEEEDGSGNASGDDDNADDDDDDDDEYLPTGLGNQSCSVQGAGNGRRDSYSAAATTTTTTYSPQSFISPPASPNRRSNNAGNAQSAPSTPSRRRSKQPQVSPPPTPQRRPSGSATTTAATPVVAKQQAGVQLPYILVRGARKSSWQRLEDMKDLNSKPYKYCMRLVLPYKQETRSSSPYYRIQAEDLALRIISIDNSDPSNRQILLVEDGITLEKVVKTNTTPNGKEIDLRVCFHCYSHGFNRQGFCVEIIDTCENVVLMRSGEFKIFARRKRTASGSSAGSSGKKRKTSHPGK